MCGINGIFQFTDSMTSGKLSEIVHGMNDLIVHRGPDHEGLYSTGECCLGMRRLSIIDLDGGNQPVWNEDRTLFMVFNGEIYNFQELKSRLQSVGHVFRTRSDTEVIVHGYEEYGVDVVKRLEGMFAFALYDTVKHRLFLARDRIGEKPLYYHLDGNRIIFGSELKSLFHSGLIEREIDPVALSQFFQLTYIPAPRSILNRTFKLPQASYALIEADGRMEISEYWTLSKAAENPFEGEYEVSKRLLREKLYRSVEQRMISDVPLGAFLSGGFDSSIVVGIMSDISEEPVNTFTVAFDEKEYDESDLAAIVAKKNRTNHHVIRLDSNELKQNVYDLLDNMDEPFADSSLIATYSVSKRAREFVTVVLTGDAGDELFAGYTKYLAPLYTQRYRKVPAVLRKGIIEPLVKRSPQDKSIIKKANKLVRSADLTDYDLRKQYMCLGFKEHECEVLFRFPMIDDMRFINDFYRMFPEFDEQKRTQFTDLKVVLEGDMLPKVDRASMLASLETRVPMLDTGVVEYAFSLPTQFKIDGARRKIILKEAFSDLLPEELFSAKKHGFAVPIEEWLKTIFRTEFESYLNFEFLESQGLFNPAYIKAIWENHLLGRENRFSELWTYFVFQHWYCSFFNSEHAGVEP